jgi:hypothetical protein
LFSHIGNKTVIDFYVVVQGFQTAFKLFNEIIFVHCLIQKLPFAHRVHGASKRGVGVSLETVDLINARKFMIKGAKRPIF